MKLHRRLCPGLLALLVALMVAGAPALAKQQQTPNIVFIKGDDIGWANIRVYNQGIMATKTPNLDHLENPQKSR
jgi:hypothetical protein